MGEIGSLTGQIRSLVADNAAELSTVEGNLISAAKKKVQTLLVTSCSPSEGKTVTAVSIAYALSSKTNARVLLIDGNLHTPMIHQLLSIAQTPGLTDFLTFRAASQDVMRSTEQENLTVMPSGSSIAKTAEVFEDASFPGKLDLLKSQFSYVIVDGHSVFSSSDVSVLCRHFDGVLFVVECEKTRWEVLQQAKESLLNAGGNILGAVLNKRRYYIPRKIYGKI